MHADNFAFCFQLILDFGRINREWQRFSLNNKQRKKSSNRIQIIFKMVLEFKFCTPKRPNQMQICECAWIYRWTKKIEENQDWATEPRGHRGSRAAGVLLAKLLHVQCHLLKAGHSLYNHVHQPRSHSRAIHPVNCNNDCDSPHFPKQPRTYIH